MAEPDLINHPPHDAQTRIECIDAVEAMIEAWPGESALLDILKYLWRHRTKTPVESLKKARWYLDRLIQKTEQEMR